MLRFRDVDMEKVLRALPLCMYNEKDQQDRKNIKHGNDGDGRSLAWFCNKFHEGLAWDLSDNGGE